MPSRAARRSRRGGDEPGPVGSLPDSPLALVLATSGRLRSKGCCVSLDPALGTGGWKDARDVGAFIFELIETDQKAAVN